MVNVTLVPDTNGVKSSDRHCVEKAAFAIGELDFEEIYYESHNTPKRRKKRPFV